MNRTIFMCLLAIITFMTGTIFAQDTLVTLKGEQRRVKVIAISYERIKYSDSSYQESTIKANKIAIIKYHNGTCDSLEYIKDNTSAMAMQGKHDAHRYYEKYTGATAGTFITTIVAGGIAGLIPAITCSSTPPAPERLSMPYPALKANKHYNHAYAKEAKRIKSNKVWTSFALGVALNAAFVLFLMQR